jgi:hypothetical protein
MGLASESDHANCYCLSVERGSYPLACLPAASAFGNKAHTSQAQPPGFDRVFRSLFNVRRIPVLQAQGQPSATIASRRIKASDAHFPACRPNGISATLGLTQGMAARLANPSELRSSCQPRMASPSIALTMVKK